MTIERCIPGLIAEHKITAKQGAKAQETYGRHYRRLLNDGLGEADASARASQATVDEMGYEAAQKKRQTMLQLTAQQRILRDMARLEAEGIDRYTAATKVLAKGAGREILNVEAQHQVLVSRVHTRIEGVLSEHSRNLIGETRNKSGLDDVVRERFGQDTGSRSAKELAGAVDEGMELLRQRWNAAGGSIPKRLDWGLPTNHDVLKIRAVDYDVWRDFTLTELAPSRMIDDRTGGPFTSETLELALRDVYETLSTDGWNKVTEGAPGGSSIANRRQDHRFLVFKDGDAWLRYQERFGSGNAFDTMMGHIEGMARETALMEVMGPNPAATLEWLKDVVKKRAAQDRSAVGDVFDKARVAANSMDNLYGIATGSLNSPVSATWARRMGGVRSFLTSALLGSASLAAITDVGFQAVTRGFNGLPITGALTGYVKLLNPLAAEDRKIAIRLGLIGEEASKMAASMMRFVDGSHGPEVMRRLSDAVMRVSGLSVWTQVGRWAFGMETLGHLADVRGQTWGELDPALSGMMARYGIGEPDWNAIRSTPVYEPKPGAEFLRPDDVADQALGDKMLRMVLTETDYAVPTTTARSRAFLSGGAQPGTFVGEVMRSAGLFKSFGVSMLMTHGARTLAEKGWNRAKYFVALTGTTTLLGALVVQLQEVSKGKDMKDMSTWQFWGKALAQGGGWGIFGDFLTSSESRFGGGLVETMAGPVVGMAADLKRSAETLGRDALDPAKDANFGKEGIKLLKRYMPGGSLWYARLAYERLLLDWLGEQIDPDFADSAARMEDRALREEGQEFYWRPGDPAPERAPEMAEAP